MAALIHTEFSIYIYAFFMPTFLLFFKYDPKIMPIRDRSQYIKLIVMGYLDYSVHISEVVMYR